MTRFFAGLLVACVTLSFSPVLAAELPVNQEKTASSSTSATERAGTDGDYPLLRLTPDKPETIQLERAAVNVLIGNDTHLQIIPDTSRNLILMPRKPGTTYFKVLDAAGDIIMQRHVVIAPPKHNYVRIRRACTAAQPDCKAYSMYYCPDICHEMDLPQQAGVPTPMAPPEQVSTSAAPPPIADGDVPISTPLPQ
ncbi:MAG: pilus assembly protein N-terminal domain-containing protein [Pseudomonadota bacterium]